MSGLLYEQNRILIAIVLYAIVLIANEIGFCLGRRFGKADDQGGKSQTNAIQAGMLGLLALLLGFTFSMALQRFDSRSEALVDEANAIGTASLRIQLLDERAQAEATKLMDDYVALRIRAGKIDLTQSGSRTDMKEAAAALQGQLWTVAVAASESGPSPATTGLFSQSLNELIDSYGRRDAALNKQVPEIVILLLFAVFVVTAAVLGYAAGLGGSREDLRRWRCHFWLSSWCLSSSIWIGPEEVSSKSSRTTSSNWRHLQRVDLSINISLIVTPFSGSLFLVRRNGDPRFQECSAPR